MRFSGMADELEAQLQDPTAYTSLSFEDRVGLIVDAEWNRRHKNKLAKRSIICIAAHCCGDNIKSRLLRSPAFLKGLPIYF
jgi:hypothetical protein